MSPRKTLVHNAAKFPPRNCIYTPACLLEFDEIIVYLLFGEVGVLLQPFHVPRGERAGAKVVRGLVTHL